MFWLGFVIGGALFGIIGLLIGANNPQLVKKNANVVKDKVSDEVAKATTKKS